MNITIEQSVEATREVHDLIRELYDVPGALLCGAAGRPRGRLCRCRDIPPLRRGKRMYTRPAAPGRGVAKALRRRIEGEARAAGEFALRLETGIRQREAIALYKGIGFRQRGPFGPYAAMPTCNIATSFFSRRCLCSQPQGLVTR